MADQIDLANDNTQRRIDEALARRRASVPSYVAQHVPADCEECGEAIPAARREAAPWASTCVECQAALEHKARGYR